MESIDRISETFTGKTVLITGATGFIGKVLLEKLLRLCPKIGKIILVVRCKKGQDPKERVEAILKSPLFGPLLSSQCVEKILPLISVVNGDMSEKDLAMSEGDRAICRSANIIVHCAATVRFDADIKSSVMLNTRGTQCMLELAKQCSKLELFVLVSTAYCHPEQKVLENKLYPPPSDARETIELLENADEASIKILEPKLLGTYPNTYVYSKALAESIAEEYMNELPVVILRPSVVVPIYKDPLKGWTDNLNGPTGLLIGAGKGVIRTMCGDEHKVADFVPVDIVVNALMALVWDYVSNGCHHKAINVGASELVTVTWRDVIEEGKKVAVEKVPFDNILWYPGGSLTKSKHWHWTRVFLFQWIPALLVDALLFCLGYQPVLIRAQTKITKSFQVLEYYTKNEWKFKIETMFQLRDKLNDKEKNLYILHAEGFNVHEYFEAAAWAARRYILKEKDENLPRAKMMMNVMWCLDIGVKTIFYLGVFYWFACKLKLINIF